MLEYKCWQGSAPFSIFYYYGYDCFVITESIRSQIPAGVEDFFQLTFVEHHSTGCVSRKISESLVVTLLPHVLIGHNSTTTKLGLKDGRKLS